MGQAYGFNCFFFQVSEQIGTMKYLSIVGLRLSGAFFFDQPFYISWLWPIIRVSVSPQLDKKFLNKDVKELAEFRSSCQSTQQR